MEIPRRGETVAEQVAMTVAHLSEAGIELRPGISSEQILRTIEEFCPALHERLAEVDKLPADYLEWWSAHNGVLAQPDQPVLQFFAPSHCELVELRRVLNDLHSAVIELDRQALDALFESACLPVFSTGSSSIYALRESEDGWRLWYKDRDSFQWTGIPSQNETQDHPSLARWLAALNHGYSTGSIGLQTILSAGTTVVKSARRVDTTPDDYQAMDYPWLSGLTAPNF